MSEFQPGMQFVYLPGKQNVLADGLSRRPDYMSAGQPVLLSLDKENTAVPVDIACRQLTDRMTVRRYTLALVLLCC